MGLANYGYADALGDFFITVDVDKCDGCGECVEACPEDILVVEEDDYGELKVRVKDKPSRQIGYICPACASSTETIRYPCERICEQKSIWHSF